MPLFFAVLFILQGPGEDWASQLQNKVFPETDRLAPTAQMTGSKETDPNQTIVADGFGLEFSYRQYLETPEGETQVIGMLGGMAWIKEDTLGTWQQVFPEVKEADPENLKCFDSQAELRLFPDLKELVAALGQKEIQAWVLPGFVDSSARLLTPLKTVKVCSMLQKMYWCVDSSKLNTDSGLPLALKYIIQQTNQFQTNKNVRKQVLSDWVKNFGLSQKQQKEWIDALFKTPFTNPQGMPPEGTPESHLRVDGRWYFLAQRIPWPVASSQLKMKGP